MFGRKSKEDKAVEMQSIPEEIAPNTPLPLNPGDPEVYTVGFMGKEDKSNPQRYSNAKKGRLLFGASMLLLVAAWGSAIAGPALPAIEEVFHVGEPVAALTISLYVVGFAVGPIAWGPVSSLYGRRLPLLVGQFALMLFFFAAATAKDYQTYVICRFFQGIFGAGSLTIGPAIVGDAFTATGRGFALSIVSLCVAAGPLVAPIVGGYIVQSYLGWRWTQYISGIMAALSLVLGYFILPETYPPTILNAKAQRLRDVSGNWGIQGPGEFEKKHIPITTIILASVGMLVQEVILALVSLYHGIIYGILYMCLEAVPIVFEGYHFEGANIYLPYVAILTGAIIVCVFNASVLDPWCNKQLRLKKKSVLPENRLVLMMIASFAFTSGIFWMCWAGHYANKVHWMLPMVGGAFVGFGIIGIFIGCFNYILDVYLARSALAFAANTFLRSSFGCAFPLFTSIMFNNLHSQWAGTLVGCLAALCLPIPFLFYIYGPKLRAMSKYAVGDDELMGAVLTRTRTDTGEHMYEDDGSVNGLMDTMQRDEVEEQEGAFRDVNQDNGENNSDDIRSRKESA